MEVICAMRVHDFLLTESIVIPAMESLADGFVFLFHPDNQERNARLREHPKYRASAIWDRPFRNAPTMLAVLELAAKCNPSFVLAPDSDMLFPDRFPYEFQHFKDSDRWSMDLRNFECWDDMNHIVADNCYRNERHCMVMRWERGLEIGGYHKAHRFHWWNGRAIYRCPFPLRHLAFMTPELRELRYQRGINSRRQLNWRAEVEGSKAWPKLDHPTIEYNQQMTWKMYLQRAKQWKR